MSNSLQSEIQRVEIFISFTFWEQQRVLFYMQLNLFVVEFRVIIKNSISPSKNTDFMLKYISSEWNLIIWNWSLNSLYFRLWPLLITKNTKTWYHKWLWWITLCKKIKVTTFDNHRTTHIDKPPHLTQSKIFHI